MRTRALHTLLIPLVLLMCATLLTACGSEPQERYEQANAHLKDARQARDQAAEKLKDKREELAELQANLNESQAKLDKARKKVASASQALNKTVNDKVLFRSIQRQLLDKDHFDDAAISVGVKNRVVTLTGNVPDDKTHKRALKIAKSQAGVQRVVDHLQVGEDKQNDSQNNAGNT